jgi:hypothetical protein
VKVLVTGRVPTIIYTYMLYTYHTKFAAYMAVSFIAFFHILLVPFLSLYIRLHVLNASVQFCKSCILLLCLCILIVMYVLF